MGALGHFRELCGARACHLLDISAGNLALGYYFNYKMLYLLHERFKRQVVP